MESLNRIIPNLKYSLNLNFIDMNINFAPLSEEILNNTQKIAINISYGAILVVLFFLLSQRLKALSLVSFEKNKQNVVLMIVAFVLFFLSYLPVYIWYISTRHNYLPTVFIGFFIAAILSIVDVCLRNKQISLIIFWIFIFIVPFRIAYYDFEDNIYKSSNVWSKSYEIRRSFYFNLVQKGVVSDNTKCIVIKNAPEIYKIAPFFASEQVSISLDYLTNKSLKNSTKDCENLIVYHNECYNIKSDYFEFENRITVVQVSPFNQAKDSMLAYSVIPKCE